MMGRATRRHGSTVVLLLTVVAGMVGLSFASVPLYRLFCAATGYGGTTQRASTAPQDTSKALITVRFDTDISPDLAWEFRPLVSEVQVHPGGRRRTVDPSSTAWHALESFELCNIPMSALA